MTLPDVHVEIALTTDPLTRPGAMDWTRIDTTCGVRSLETNRGVGLRSGRMTTGTASAVLDNRTGDLDPANTAGTWYPDLTLRKRVRLSIDGTDRLFTGFVDELPLAWDPSGSDGWVRLDAVDLMGLIAQVQLGPSVLHDTTIGLEPVAYWPLADAAGRVVADVVGVNDAEHDRPIATTRTLFPYDPRPRPTLSGPNAWIRTPAVLPASATMTVSFWASYTGSGGTPRMWLQETGDITDANLAIVLEPDEVSVTVRDGTTTQTAVAYMADPSALHHYCLRIDNTLSAHKVSLWVDGSAIPWDLAGVGDPTDPFTGVVDLAAFAAGLATPNTYFGLVGDGSTVTGAEATVGDYAFWDRALDDDEIVELYEAGATAWAGDTTGERVARILDTIGVDPDDRDLDPGTVTCGPTLLNENASAYLERIAATEGGALFVSADGKVTFQEQYPNDPTPLDVIGDAGCPYSDITLDYSLWRVLNTVTVTPELGDPYTYTDPTSAAAYGTLTADLSTVHANPSGVRSRAAELVVRSKDLRQQITGLTLRSVDPRVPSSVSVDTEIGDPYTVQYQPAGIGTPQTVLVRVESIRHRLEGGDWSTELSVDQQVVLPDCVLDTAGQGVDQSVLAS